MAKKKYIVTKREKLMNQYAKLCGYNYAPFGWDPKDYTAAGWKKLIDAYKKVYFDGQPATIIDRMTEKVPGVKKGIKMVLLEFKSGRTSWEVSDDARMETPEQKAKLDKMVQVIKLAPTSRRTLEFCKAIDSLLK